MKNRNNRDNRLSEKKQNRTVHIVIAGAGASGLMAAVTAAEAGAAVTVIEQKEKAGKKILATGNGHCNFTNSALNSACYHENLFAMQVIGQFSVERTLDFFKKLGIFPHERNGYYYPASEQASAVVSLLLKRAEQLGVKILVDSCVEEIRKMPEDRQKQADRSTFQVLVRTAIKSGVKETIKKNGKKKVTVGEVRYENRKISADRVILACGGQASPALGSDGSGYRLAGALGHRIVTPFPALTGICCREEWFPRVSGVRVSARVTLFADGRRLASDAGELQLTDYGISGIPVFQVSRYAARALAEGKEVQAELYFYPEISEEDMLDYLKQHNFDEYRGLYPEKLLAVLMMFGNDTLPRKLLCTCTEVNGFDRAQVTCGGVALEEVNPQTMESQICPGIYFAGELLDVDGICGGYNLQWAWSSGYLAGSCAAGGEYAADGKCAAGGKNRAAGGNL
ncbi:MAG: FAD-dependent oxidoreductase [Lachnospiraceae bacterium]|nr:FAD-dependent oxidoreductase [Lachnospiraceae bacterium]